MKKLIASICTLACLLGLVGCNHQTYQFPHDQFCYSADGSQVVEISPDGREYIIDLLNKSSWIYRLIIKPPSTDVGGGLLCT